MGMRTGWMILAAAWMVGGGELAAAEQSADVATATHVEAAGEPQGGQFDRVTMVRELMRRRGGDAAAAAQLVQLCREFSPADATGAYEALALAHEAAGNINLAADARLLMSQSYPEEPLARQAMLWLTRVYCSSEIAHHQRPPDRAASADADKGSALYAYHVADGARGAEPALVFARAVAARRAGLKKPAATLVASLEHSRTENGWRDCARTEAWLAGSREEEAPKLVAGCARAVEAPRLDGVLDEACWERAKPRAAGEADAQWAYDSEYLYVAVRCDKRDGVAYPRDDRPRERDADLAAFDRVRLLVDVDRDYATWYDLTVDSRGWTHDACWGDAGWDPEWFVALGDPPGEWAVEAAIGWGDFGVVAPRAGAAWAVGVERLEADPKPQAVGPEGFTVLVFE